MTDRRIQKLWRDLGKVDGFAEGASIFSDSDDDRAYFVNGTQVANVEDDHLGLRLTRRVISAHRPELRAHASVDLRRSGSDWIVVHIASPADAQLALRLATFAADAHRPADGSPLRPPPEGAELARRRRFH